MKPAKLWKEVEAIIEADGDSCSVCGKAFEDQSVTYAGVMIGGRVALVGECCRSKMKSVYGGSIYLKPNKSRWH